MFCNIIYCNQNANALQPHSNRIANGMRNDAIKGKESKGKKKKGGSPSGDEIQPGMVL